MLPKADHDPDVKVGASSSLMALMSPCPVASKLGLSVSSAMVLKGGFGANTPVSHPLSCYIRDLWSGVKKIARDWKISSGTNSGLVLLTESLQHNSCFFLR